MTNLTDTEVLALLSAAKLNKHAKLLNLISTYKNRNSHNTPQNRPGLKQAELKLLEQAIQFGYIDIIIFCLDEYLDSLDAKLRENQIPAIIWAVTYHQIRVVQLLIKKEARIHGTMRQTERSKLFISALVLAIEKGNVEIAKLIRANISADEPISFHDYILHGVYKLELIDLVLKIDARYLNGEDQYARTPLIRAAQDGRLKTVQALIQHGADLNKKMNSPEYIDHQFTALDYAVSRNQVDIANLLITTPGIVINKSRLLCIASAFSSIGMVKFLLRNYASSLNVHDKNELFKSKIGRYSNPVEIKRKWMLPRSDVTTVNQNAYTFAQKKPLHYAIEHNNLGSMKVLISAGAIYNPLHKRFPKPIQYAAFCGSINIFEFFVEQNPSDLNCRNAAKQTLLYIAVSAGHEDIVAYLLKREIHVQEKLASLRLADRRMHYNIVNMLILSMSNELSQIELLGWIRTYEQAFDFIKRCPINSQLLFNDVRIKSLLENAALQDNKYLNYYEPESISVLHRSKSFFVQLDNNNGESHVYFETKKLSHGTYGNARVFSSPDRADIVIKSNENEHKINKTESDFIKKAYPSARLGYFFNFTIQQHCPDKKVRTQRLVMPFFKGKTLSNYKQELESKTKLFLLILHLVKAFLDLHEKGISHNDIAARNIIVNEHDGLINISFIDFGFAVDFHTTSKKLNDGNALQTLIQSLLQQNSVIGHQLVLDFDSIQHFVENDSANTDEKINQFYGRLLSDYHALLAKYQSSLDAYAQPLREKNSTGAIPTLFC